MSQVVNEVLNKHKGKTTLIVGHGDPLAFILQYLINYNKQLPSIIEIKSTGMYPQKNEAWKLVFDAENNIMEWSRDKVWTTLFYI